MASSGCRARLRRRLHPGRVAHQGRRRSTSTGCCKAPGRRSRDRGLASRVRQAARDRAPHRSHQQDLLYADDHETLSRATRRLFEHEANYGAAELLFQREIYARYAVWHLADRFRSSLRAAPPVRRGAPASPPRSCSSGGHRRLNRGPGAARRFCRRRNAMSPSGGGTGLSTCAPTGIRGHKSPGRWAVTAVPQRGAARHIL